MPPPDAFMVEVGGEAGPAEVPAVPRPLSALRLGLLRLVRALVAREPLPDGRLYHQDWPEREWISDLITEDIMNGC